MKKMREATSGIIQGGAKRVDKAIMQSTHVNLETAGRDIEHAFHGAAHAIGARGIFGFAAAGVIGVVLGTTRTLTRGIAGAAYRTTKSVVKNTTEAVKETLDMKMDKEVDTEKAVDVMTKDERLEQFKQKLETAGGKDKDGEKPELIKEKEEKEIDPSTGQEKEEDLEKSAKRLMSLLFRIRTKMAIMSQMIKIRRNHSMSVLKKRQVVVSSMRKKAKRRKKPQSETKKRNEIQADLNEKLKKKKSSKDKPTDSGGAISIKMRKIHIDREQMFFVQRFGSTRKRFKKRRKSENFGSKNKIGINGTICGFDNAFRGNVDDVVSHYACGGSSCRARHCSIRFSRNLCDISRDYVGVQRVH
jgi:hypothetical protein